MKLFPDFDPSWLSLAPNAHCAFRSGKGLVTADQSITMFSTRRGSLADPKRYVGCPAGLYVLAIDPYEIVLINIDNLEMVAKGAKS